MTGFVLINLNVKLSVTFFLNINYVIVSLLMQVEYLPPNNFKV